MGNKPIYAAQIGPDIDLSLIPIDEDGWQWVRIFPFGDIIFSDGRGPFVYDAISAATVAASFSGKLLVDYDHHHTSSYDTQMPGDSRASGWIHKIVSAMPDGSFVASGTEPTGLESETVGENYGAWALIQWTPSAKEGIESREWSYISPEFFADDDGRVLKFGGAGLTNVPAITELDLMAATATEEENKMGDDKKTPSDTWKVAAAKLGIKAETEGEYLAALDAIKASADQAAEAKKKAEDLEAEKVEREAREKATGLVMAAVKEGKLEDDESTVKAYTEMATTNPEQFEAIMAATKPRKEMPPQGKEMASVSSGSSDDDKDVDGPIQAISIPSDLGVSDEKTKAAQAVLASAKLDLKTAAGRRAAMRAYRNRVTGAVGGA